MFDILYGKYSNHRHAEIVEEFSGNLFEAVKYCADQMSFWKWIRIRDEAGKVIWNSLNRMR